MVKITEGNVETEAMERPEGSLVGRVWGALPNGRLAVPMDDAERERLSQPRRAPEEAPHGPSSFFRVRTFAVDPEIAKHMDGQPFQRSAGETPSSETAASPTSSGVAGNIDDEETESPLEPFNADLEFDLRFISGDMGDDGPTTEVTGSGVLGGRVRDDMAVSEARDVPCFSAVGAWAARRGEEADSSASMSSATGGMNSGGANNVLRSTAPRDSHVSQVWTRSVDLIDVDAAAGEQRATTPTTNADPRSTTRDDVISSSFHALFDGIYSRAEVSRGARSFNSGTGSSTIADLPRPVNQWCTPTVVVSGANEGHVGIGDVGSGSDCSTPERQVHTAEGSTDTGGESEEGGKQYDGDSPLDMGNEPLHFSAGMSPLPDEGGPHDSKVDGGEHVSSLEEAMSGVARIRVANEALSAKVAEQEKEIAAVSAMISSLTQHGEVAAASTTSAATGEAVKAENARLHRALELAEAQAAAAIQAKEAACAAMKDVEAENVSLLQERERCVAQHSAVKADLLRALLRPLLRRQRNASLKRGFDTMVTASRRKQECDHMEKHIREADGIAMEAECDAAAAVQEAANAHEELDRARGYVDALSEEVSSLRDQLARSDEVAKTAQEKARQTTSTAETRETTVEGRGEEAAAIPVAIAAVPELPPSPTDHGSHGRLPGSLTPCRADATPRNGGGGKGGGAARAAMKDVEAENVSLLQERERCVAQHSAVKADLLRALLRPLLRRQRNASLKRGFDTMVTASRRKQECDHMEKHIREAYDIATEAECDAAAAVQEAANAHEELDRARGYVDALSEEVSSLRDQLARSDEVAKTAQEKARQTTSTAETRETTVEGRGEEAAAIPVAIAAVPELPPSPTDHGSHGRLPGPLTPCRADATPRNGGGGKGSGRVPPSRSDTAWSKAHPRSGGATARVGYARLARVAAAPSRRGKQVGSRAVAGASSSAPPSATASAATAASTSTAGSSSAAPSSASTVASASVAAGESRPRSRTQKRSTVVPSCAQRATRSSAARISAPRKGFDMEKRGSYMSFR